MDGKRNNQTRAPVPDDLAGHLGDRMRLSALSKIILASASPRRAEILRTVNWPFEILPMDVDETRKGDEDAATYVQRLARAKAEAAARRSTGSTIVAADTVVVINEQILGKPRDRDDARSMLRQVSGQWHQVLTGVALIDNATSDLEVAYETTEVKFAVMS